jgi:prevent-host-death family protein
MVEVASRELRNDTAGVLRRVEAGETVVITVRGKAVADLIPHRRDEPRWMPRAELLDLLKTHSADPGLRDDLERLAGETTDEDGLDRLW